MPGRFELGVARRNGTLGDVLEKITAAAQETKRREQKSIVQLAMEAACTDRMEDRKTFSSVMLRKDPDDCREVIYRFGSERRAARISRRKSRRRSASSRTETRIVAVFRTVFSIYGAKV